METILLFAGMVCCTLSMFLTIKAAFKKNVNVALWAWFYFLAGYFCFALSTYLLLWVNTDFQVVFILVAPMIPLWIAIGQAKFGISYIREVLISLVLFIVAFCIHFYYFFAKIIQLQVNQFFL